MTLLEITIRNLLRRKTRAVFVLAGLAIGIATMVGVITYSLSMTDMINHKLEKYGANILIIPRTEHLGLSYGGVSLGGVSVEMARIRESELEAIRHIPNAANIAALGPMVLGAVRSDDRRLLLAGIDFSSYRQLKPWWRVRGQIPGDGELLVGADAARLLGTGVDRHLRLNDRSFRVAGLLETTGSQDDAIIFTALNTAQRILGKPGEVSMVEVAALCSECPIDDMVRQMSAALPNARVMAIQQVVRGRMETLAQFRRFSFGISAVVLAIAGMVVMVSMMSSVRERTEEIGILRAIGYRRSHVMRIVLMEAFILSALAGAAGMAVGTATAAAALHVQAESAAAVVRIDPVLAMAAIGAAIVLGLLASIYPARIAAGMDPNDALRAL